MTLHPYICSMAMASTKSWWETGEVQIQSEAKTLSCKVRSPPEARLGCRASAWEFSSRPVFLVKTSMGLFRMNVGRQNTETLQ